MVVMCALRLQTQARDEGQRLINCLDSAARFDALLLIGQIQAELSGEPDPKVAHRRIMDNLRTLAAAEARGVEMVLELVTQMKTAFNSSLGCQV